MAARADQTEIQIGSRKHWQQALLGVAGTRIPPGGAPKKALLGSAQSLHAQIWLERVRCLKHLDNWSETIDHGALQRGRIFIMMSLRLCKIALSALSEQDWHGREEEKFISIVIVFTYIHHLSS